MKVVEGRFQRPFLAPRLCIKTFTHTPHVVGLDACHIKAGYGGALLVLTVLDVNGQVFPGALAVTESENVETWRWFLALIRTAFALEDGRGVVVLSDREKGIDIALSELLPSATHSFCVYHIMKNVKTHFHTSLNGLLFAAANASTIEGFNKIIGAIKGVNVKAGEYIEKIDPSKWARCHFPAPRFGHITSNVSE